MKFLAEGTVMGIVNKTAKRKDGTEFVVAKVDLYQAGERENVQVSMKPEDVPQVGQVVQIPVLVRAWAIGGVRTFLDVSAIT